MKREKDPRLPALARRVQQCVDAVGSIREAAEQTGLPINSVSRLYHGSNEPNAFALDRFASGMGVSLKWLLDGTGPKADQPTDYGLQRRTAAPVSNDITRIPVLDVEAAAGSGRFNDLVKELDSISWPRAFLRKLGANPRRTESLRAKGDSMAPTIDDGALLLLDRSQKDLPAIRQGGRRRHVMPDIYVLIQGDDLRIKRVERLPRDYLALISDNFAEYPPEIVELSKVRLIGKVVWWDNRL